MTLEPSCGPQEWKSKVHVKEELVEETYGQTDSVFIKEEPRSPKSDLKCDIKEESGRQYLYNEHKIKVEIMMDSSEPTCESSIQTGNVGGYSQVHPAKNPVSSTWEQSTIHNVGHCDKGSGEQTALQHQIDIKQYATSSQFYDHLKLHPKETSQAINQDQRNTLLIAQVKVDILAEKDYYTCDVRTEKFTHKKDLYKHKQSHTENKPYTCDLCKKTFTKKKYLVRHKQTHTGEKLYSCVMECKNNERNY